MDGLYSHSYYVDDSASVGWPDDSVRRDNETFVNSLGDSLRTLNDMIHCTPYRRIGDAPSSVLRERGPPVAMENHSSQSFEGSRSLPQLENYRLDSKNIDGTLSQSDWNESKGKAAGGKRAPGEKTKPGNCKVCGDDATGMYFGALVCVPCKTFFLRYEGDNFNFKCKGNEDCEITMTTRTQCKFCRYQKCRKAGMFRRVRPANINPSEGQQLCVVCNDVANGVHFGAITCEGCKKFFRRGLTEHPMYTCKNGQNCVINPRTRNSCRYCRYQTCLNVGMSRDAIQMGRPSKLAMENQGLVRGMRHANSNSGTNRADPNTSNRQVTTNAGRPKDLTSHYLMGNHHPKEEPRSWDWPVEQPAGNPYHTDLGHFAGQLTNVCDLFDSPAKPVGMDSYATAHLTSALLTPSCSSNSGDRNSSSSCLSHISSASPDGPMHCTNSGWGEIGGDISKSVAVQPVQLNALYHNSGGSVQQMASTQTYLPCTTGSQEIQLFTKFYHEKNNIPQYLGVSSTGDDMLHFSPNSGGLQQSWKLGHYDQDKEMKEMLESLLDPCQTQEHINDYSNDLERFDLKYDSAVSFMNPPLGQQLMADKNRGRNKNLPENNGIYPYNCGQSSISGQKKEPELVNPTHIRPLNNNNNNNGSNCITEIRLSQGQDRSDHFSAANKASSPSLSVTPQTVPCGGLPQFDGPVVASPSSAEPNRLAGAAVAMRFPPPPPQITLPDEARTGFDSAKEWIVKIQNHLSDDNEYEDEIQEADSLSDELTEICKGLQIDGIPFEQQIERSAHYWRSQDLPDENIMVGAEHWAIFNHVHPLYTNFVNVGSTWNHNLRVKFEQLQMSNKELTVHQIEEWVNENVIPIYKDLAFNYFSQIQGFKEFDVKDQEILLRLAQSQSRILAAVTAWFDPDNPNFTNFLPWRDLKAGQVDVFEQHLIAYAKKIHARKLDPVEAALFNIVVVIATDYPGLTKPELIESRRTQFLATFRAYTTAKYGTPNRKMELLFQLVPQLRRLGYLHYAMTTKPSLGIITRKSKEV